MGCTKDMHTTGEATLLIHILRNNSSIITVNIIIAGFFPTLVNINAAYSNLLKGNQLLVTYETITQVVFAESKRHSKGT
jgi:hypothetical protein